MNRINKLLDKLKYEINNTKDIDNDWFVEQALTTLDELKKQLTLTDVSQQRELLFCGGCGTKLTRYVETDINSPKICRNKLCKQNNCG